MPAPKTPRTRKLRVDDHEVLLEATDATGIDFADRSRWAPTSIHSIRVDDVPRGFACYGYGRNRADPGWRAYVFGTSFTGDGSEPRLQARAIRSGGSRDEVAALFPRLVALDLAPTVEEATAAVERKAAEIAQERARRARERESERRERQDAVERAAEELRSMTEGLRSIRERLSPELTNFETDAVERALAHLDQLASSGR